MITSDRLFCRQAFRGIEVAQALSFCTGNRRRWSKKLGDSRHTSGERKTDISHQEKAKSWFFALEGIKPFKDEMNLRNGSVSFNDVASRFAIGVIVTQA